VVKSPQAQLVYQAINFDSFNDGAADIRFDNMDSLAGRIGARVARTWAVAEDQQGDGNNPRLATVWGRVNGTKEILGLWIEQTEGQSSGCVS
jgi:outer membrane autotransporter protein